MENVIQKDNCIFLHSALKLMNFKTKILKVILKALNEQGQSTNYK